MKGFSVLAALVFAAGNCCAQSYMENGQKRLPVYQDPFSPLNAETPAMSSGQNLKIMFGNESLSFSGMEYYDKQYSANAVKSYNEIFTMKNLGLHAFSSENTYINLLGSRSTAIMLDYQKGNFSIKAGGIANRYATAGGVTTQLGINGFLEYDLSPQWSVAVFGTIYNSNPYFSMAAFPFVGTSSYGGYIKYEGEKVGMKVGARRYYDAFQRQWKMEPIITPSIKVGKKMRIELPVGPLVQKSMEKLLKRPTNDGPMITPGF